MAYEYFIFIALFLSMDLVFQLIAAVIKTPTVGLIKAYFFLIKYMQA